MKKTEILQEDLIEHFNYWFSHNWDHQSGAQIFAMTVALVKKLGIEITYDIEPPERNGED